MKKFILVSVVALASTLGACATPTGAMKDPVTASASKPIFTANRAKAVQEAEKAKAAIRTGCRAEALTPDGQTLGRELAKADLKAELQEGQYLSKPTAQQISDAYVADCMGIKAPTTEAINADQASLYAPVGPK